MMGSLTFSDCLGYASIICWLGAQFPQVVENYRRKSVEGLALPFLLSWLLGDFTNLLGCILTHQLPFQTYLAVYFVFVDCSLICQYAYYSKRTPPATYHRARSVSYPGRIAPDERHLHYRTISTVAANVAATAALAAKHEATSPRLQRSQCLLSSPDELLEGTRRSSSDLTDSDEIEEETLAHLADSFHSEGGPARKKHVSWSKERGRRAGSLGSSRTHASASLGQARPSLPTSQSEDEQFDQRGRSLERSTTGQGWQHSREGSSHVGRESTSRVSKRSASMVFLSVWALFGVGTLVGSGRGLPGNKLMVGRVLSSADAPLIPYEFIPITHVEHVISEHPAATATDISTPIEPKPPPPYEKPSWERVIGRISAWICTTLYLTSRLPQIWKNFVRKSVEGLSMYLFVFAFLGNFFYVTSLLTSPKMELPGAANFIKESIPYILGSGGTLTFDVTIVTQSFLYRPSSEKRGRRNSTRSNRNIAPEEEGLLSADEVIVARRRRTISDLPEIDTRS